MEQNELMKKQHFSAMIRERILSGALRPGDRLPAERSLAEEFGISRGSVNQGILDLEREGFLQVVPRRGTFVSDYVNQATADTLSALMNFSTGSMDRSLFLDFMDMRILIERECVRLACVKLSKESIACLTQASADLFASDAQHCAPAVFAYHLALSQISGNTAYLMVFRSFEPMIKTFVSLHFSHPQEYERALPLYSELTVSILYGDAEKADRTLRTIMENATNFMKNNL